MNIKTDICPYCNGTEFVEGYQGGYATVTSRESAWLGAELNHVICRRCGTVVRSYVKDPEKLFKKKDRK